MKERTDEEIVEQTNELAIEIASFLGWKYADGHPLYLSKNPRAQQFWALACLAQQKLTATDPEDALSAIELDVPEFAGDSI